MKEPAEQLGRFLPGMHSLRKFWNQEIVSVVGGISIWPTQVLRFLVIVLAAVFLSIAQRRLARNASDLETQIARLPARSEPPEPSETQSIAAWLRSLQVAAAKHLNSLKIWLTRLKEDHRKTFRRLVERRRDISVSNWSPKADPKFLDIWSQYKRLGAARHRYRRVLPWAAGFLLFGLTLILLLGEPRVPFRGQLSRYVNGVLLYPAVYMMLVLMFFVVDATRLCGRLIAHLSSGKVEWPESAFQRGGGEVPDAVWSEWLTVRLIGRRTEVVDRLIYFPVVTAVLMMLARASLFDNWGFPTVLLVLAATYLAFVLLCIVLLRRGAKNARRSAINRLVEERLAHGDRARDVDLLLGRIENYRRGAYAPLAQQPIVQAILLPTGGFGALAAFEYLAAF